MRETLIQSAIMGVLNQRDSTCRVWRNNVGQTPTPCGACKSRLCAGCAARLQRPVAYGLGVGSSDLVGIDQIVITPDMVGQTFARFFVVEVKTPTGRLSKEQELWQQVVRNLGGDTHVWRSEEDARAHVIGKKRGVE